MYWGKGSKKQNHNGKFKMSAIRVLTRISNLKALKWAPMDTSGCHIFQGSGRWQG